MWRRFGLYMLSASLYDAFGAVHLSVMASEQGNTTSSGLNITSGSAGTSVTFANAPSSSTPSSDSSEGWHMKPVVSVQARVQGDAPVWNDEAQLWLSKFGSTTEEAYTNNLDTVNTASVEGALMFVQAEGINVKEQSVKCERKNKMQYVVFYELTIVQPTDGIKYYESHTTPEYGNFVAMDGGKCTDEGSDLPKNCKVYYGLDGELDIGPMVGSNLQASDKRAPYPDNYWFSYPGSCAQKLRADKTQECREEYPGGLCAMGDQPDGEKCTFSYKILGFINIDELVGITKLGYSSYTEFCEDGGIEFKATNTGSGFKVEESIDFWKDPSDEEANAARTASMVKMYNKMVSSGTVTNMLPLPSIESLTSSNPKCEENSAQCANAPNGCRRDLYSQICSVCSSGGSCKASHTSSSFPDLKLPTKESRSRLDSSEDSDTSNRNAKFESATTPSNDNNQDNDKESKTSSHLGSMSGHTTDAKTRSNAASPIKMSVVGIYVTLVASSLV